MLVEIRQCGCGCGCGWYKGYQERRSTTVQAGSSAINPCRRPHVLECWGDLPSAEALGLMAAGNCNRRAQ